MRAFHFIVGVVWVNARDEALARASAGGVHPQDEEFDRALEDGEATDRYPRLRRGRELADGFRDFDQRFDFEIHAAVAGLAASHPASDRSETVPN